MYTIFNVEIGDLSTCPFIFPGPIKLFVIVECCCEISNTLLISRLNLLDFNDYTQSIHAFNFSSLNVFTF